MGTSGKTSTFLFSLVLVSALQSQSQSQGSRPSSRASKGNVPSALPQEKELLGEKELRAHVRFLAADQLFGRRAGTLAERAAGAYIALQFEQMGLLPKGSEGWFQTFELMLGYEVQGTPALALVGEKLHVLKRGFDFEVLPFTASGKLEAGLVFCGYGISFPGALGSHASWDDFAGKDMAGKIAVVIEGSPVVGGVQFKESLWQKIYTAKQKGASGILVLSDKKRGYLLPYASARTSSRIPGFKLALASFENFQPGMSKAIAAYRDGEGFDLDLKGKVRLTLEVNKKRGEARNVIAMIPGNNKALADEYVVLGGHYDHLGKGGEGSLELGSGHGKIHNGADDNASGIAVLIEVARKLRERKKLGRSLLLIAFSGEELGLLGSHHFVAEPSVPVSSITSMVNLDMVGRSKNNYVAVLSAGSSEVFAKILADIDPAASVSLSDSSIGSSDHQSFLANKIPAVHFFSGTHSDYHRASDDFEKLNYQGMQRIGTTVLKLVERLSNLPERPAFVALKPTKKLTAKSSGARPYVGTIPDYVEGDNGVKLSGITPGSPADKAGMKAGDILVRLNGKKIDDIYDFTNILRELLPGQKISVKVLRAGKELELNLLVGQR